MFDRVLNKIVPAVALFGEEVQRLTLSLSPMAVVTASTMKLAGALQKELQSYGMEFKFDQRVSD